MSDDVKAIIDIVAIILGSSFLSALVTQFATGHRDKNQKRKVLLAEAQASVLKRVELCYRIRRRTKKEEVDIKNRIHANQEECAYYESLLLTESEWYGNRYSLYRKAINRLTAEPMRKASKKPGRVFIEMENDILLDHDKINKLSRQFSLDSRRFLFFPMRVWMWIHDKCFGVKVYEI